MKRYFFDVVSGRHCAYDYRWRDCPTLENAFQYAELVALDCSTDAEDELIRYDVKVRSREGREIFSIPVQASNLAAA